MEKDKIIFDGARTQEEIKQTILAIIDCQGDLTQLTDKLENFHEKDIAEVLPELSQEQRENLYGKLKTDFLSEIFSYLQDPEPFIEEISSDKAADIVESMAADDAVDLLEELDEDKKQEIIDLMDKQSVNDVKLIYKYDEDSVGAMMTTDFVSVNKSFGVKQAMSTLVEQAAENDNISTIYVTDDNNVYCGAMHLRDLFVARSSTPLDDIIITSFPHLYAEDKISDVLERVKAYSEDSLPVLNSDNQLIGALTSTDIVEAVDDEMSEDYAKLAGLTQSDDLEEPVFKSVLKRLPWLAALLLLSFGVSAIIGLFESVIAQISIIVFFQPMICDMSGNLSTQSLGVTIRRLSSFDLDAKGKRTLFFKELTISFCNAMLLGIISVIIVALYLIFFKSGTYSVNDCFAISGCIGLSLAISMTVSGICGSVVPMFFKRIGIDPAAASGPLITTVNDLISAISYYGLATLLLMPLFA